MNNTAVLVRDLSKQYRIGLAKSRHDTLRDQLTEGLRALFGRNGHRGQDTIWALRDVSFEIQRGEVMGVIGRNGAGKSTLLKILSRITEPTTGFAEIRGRMSSLLEVGTGFHPELTGRENIYLNGAILGMSKAEIERKFDEIVAFSEVERFIDTPVKRYSSGMHVRLAFAVAAHLEPEILVVDEVLAVGDHLFQKKCLAKMQGMREAGRTVFFVSHNMASIANLCSKAMWLEKGRIQCLGPAKEIVSNYMTVQSDTSGEVRWDSIEVAPGNENIRLHAVRILSEQNISASVPIDRPVVVQVDYWNLKEGSVLHTALELRDKTGNYVLASNARPSANLSHDPWYGRPRTRGMFRSTCVIPANFLNDDCYSVDVAVENARNEREVHAEGVISFTVYETGEMKKEYSGHWVGIVRPKLAWRTERIDAEPVDQRRAAL